MWTCALRAWSASWQYGNFCQQSIFETYGPLEEERSSYQPKDAESYRSVPICRRSEGFFTLVTSATYHVCESLDYKFLGPRVNGV